MDEIDRLLGEGQYFDTSSFSLDSLRARQKLARFQLADSGLWLVKLVQAAVAFQAPLIDIRFKRNAVTVEFQAADLPEASHLLGLVLAGDLPIQTDLMHLVTAVRACSAGNAESVEWSSGTTLVRLDANGSRSQAHSCVGFRLTAHRPPRHRSLSQTLATSVSHLVRNVAEEYTAVVERCWACPIPIQLDGRLLDRGYDSQHLRGMLKDPSSIILQYEKSRQSTPTYCLGIRQIPPLSGRPGLCALQSQAELRKPVMKEQTWLRWENEGEYIGAALTLQAYRNCPNQIDFVCDGAVVASHRLDWKPASSGYFSVPARQNIGLRLLFAVNASELDLSQFEVRGRATLANQLFRQVEPQLTEFLKRLLAEVPNLYYIPVSSFNGKLVGVMMGGYAVGGSLLVGAGFLLPVGMVTGTVLTSWVLSHRNKVQKALKELLVLVSEGIGTSSAPV